MRVLILILILLMPLATRASGLLPSAVDSVTTGTGAGFGLALFPGNVLSGPNGGDTPPHVPNDSEEELFSLGDGGSITLAWPAGSVIVDGSGPDFTVFENVVETLTTGVPFVESAIVAVSQDGVNFVEFPFNFLPPVGFNPSTPFAIPLFAENYPGLAGVRATLTTPSNGIDPGDPAVSGGDAFDLSDVGLEWARYVRLTDTGTPGTGTGTAGSNGQPVYDLGLTLNGPPSAGFDLDTIVAVHTGPPPVSSVPDWGSYGGPRQASP